MDQDTFLTEVNKKKKFNLLINLKRHNCLIFFKIFKKKKNNSKKLNFYNYQLILYNYRYFR